MKFLLPVFPCHCLSSLAAGAALSLLSGCVHTTYYDDAPRQPVHFESQLAATTFYDAVLLERFPPPPPRSDGRASHETVTLWIGESFVTWKHVKSGNVIFNEAAAQADTNHDGLISAAEAAAFAKAMQEKYPATRQPPTPTPAPPASPA